MADKISATKPVGDQNGDALVDRVVAVEKKASLSNDTYVEYQKWDGSYSRQDPLFNGRKVTYQGREYKAFQQTADQWVNGKNLNNGKVCLVPARKKESYCKTKRAVMVEKNAVKPSLPTFYLYSAEWCAPCHFLYEQLELWVRGGWCQFYLEKWEYEKVSLAKEAGLPNFKGQLPLAAYRLPNGQWQELLQYSHKSFATETEYSQYLYSEINACGKPSNGSNF